MSACMPLTMRLLIDLWSETSQERRPRTESYVGTGDLRTGVQGACRIAVYRTANARVLPRGGGNTERRKIELS